MVSLSYMCIYMYSILHQLTHSLTVLGGSLAAMVSWKVSTTAMQMVTGIIS